MKVADGIEEARSKTGLLKSIRCDEEFLGFGSLEAKALISIRSHCSWKAIEQCVYHPAIVHDTKTNRNSHKGNNAPLCNDEGSDIDELTKENSHVPIEVLECTEKSWDSVGCGLILVIKFMRLQDAYVGACVYLRVRHFLSHLDSNDTICFCQVTREI